MNSKQKGKRGELEFAHFLVAEGFAARRGQQYAGSPDSPDIMCSGIPVHIEVKRVERLNMRDAVSQAAGDAGNRKWVVAHRWNNGPWLVTQLATDWLDLVRETIETASPITRPTPEN
jgi:hypothetical protein